MAKKILVISGFIFLLFFGCKKETSTNKQIFYLNNDYIDFKFKEGTYWIYQDWDSKSMDSIVVTKTEHGFYSYPQSYHDSPGVDHEYLQIFMESKTNHYEYSDLIESIGIRRDPSYGDLYNCGILIYSIHDQPNYSHIDSLVINRATFKNVLKCTVLYSHQLCFNAGFDYNTDLYIVPVYGTIRKVVHEPDGDKTWNLIRWNIIK